MKTSLLPAALLILSFCLFADIRNGYENKIQSARVSLEYLQVLYNNNPSPAHRQRIKLRMASIIDFISCYELTQELINQLRTVSPHIFEEMNGIKDKRGRLTDIFIKLVPNVHVKVPLRAASYFAQASIDEDAHMSEYGEYSVLIEICIVSNSLQLLCHELGHVKYVVPNLTSYSKFYKKDYDRQPIDFQHIGHSQNDESGKLASWFENKFVKDRANYLRLGGEKLETTVAIFQKIKKNTKSLTFSRPSGTIMSNVVPPYP